jgi:hypothetical protein
VTDCMNQWWSTRVPRINLFHRLILFWECHEPHIVILVLTYYQDVRVPKKVGHHWFRQVVLKWHKTHDQYLSVIRKLVTRTRQICLVEQQITQSVALVFILQTCYLFLSGYLA